MLRFRLTWLSGIETSKCTKYVRLGLFFFCSLPLVYVLCKHARRYASYISRWQDEKPYLLNILSLQRIQLAWLFSIAIEN